MENKPITPIILLNAKASKDRASQILAEKVERTVKTTIKLADSLWREVKVYAAKKGLKLAQVVEVALREYLKEEEKK